MKMKRNAQQGDDFPIGLSAPARRALSQAGVQRLDQLTQIGEAEIKKLHGMGPRGIKVLRDALASRGLSFKDEA